MLWFEKSLVHDTMTPAGNHTAAALADGKTVVLYRSAR